MNDEVYFWHVDKQQSFLQVDIIILGVCSQACPNELKLEVCISLHYLQKNMEDSIYFLSADRHESFLQVDVITLGVHTHVYPRYPK